MNNEIILRAYLSEIGDRIKDASGFTEIYHAFSTLGDGSQWMDYCHQNLMELYSGAKSLIEQIADGDPIEETWPTLDDLSFHAAIFGNYYHIFESIFTEILTEKGIPWDYPKEIISENIDVSLTIVLNNITNCFEQMMEAVIQKDIVAQRKHLNVLYLASSRVQCIVATSKANSSQCR